MGNSNWRSSAALTIMAGILLGSATLVVAAKPKSSARIVPPSLGEPLRTPPEYRSVNGVLAITIEAKPTRVVIGGQVIDGATYNGDYGGPVLRLKPGDTLRMHFVNHLPQITNVHFHGLSVTPEGHGDNSMRMIAPGESWDYVFTTAALGIADKVTTFTGSDFGRTLQSNDDGSDHGWGSMHFVMGGAVAGQKIYGTPPTIGTNTPDNVGQGRLLPTISVDQYASTLANWFGVSASDMPTVLPNIGNYNPSTWALGFV